MSHVVTVPQTLKSPAWWDNFTDFVYEEYSLSPDIRMDWYDYLESRSKELINATVAFEGFFHDPTPDMVKITFNSQKDYLMFKLKWS